jgi:hypothetical protein
MPNHDQEIYDIAIQNGFTPTSAKFVIAQSRLETGNYTSKVYRLNNNLFGMKFAGQPLATKGTIAPASELRCGGNCNGDYYSKYATHTDSIKDAIIRLYGRTMYGVTPQMLKDSATPDEYALNLKKRHYYGFKTDPSTWGPEVNNYKNAIVSLLKKINIVEIAKKSSGPLLIALGIFLVYMVYKK